VPAGLPDVITVAAADVMSDATKAFPWSWSNYGKCVDIWAPGVEIESASPECFECTAIYSGTSQATPLVSGLAAAHLAANPGDDAKAVKEALQKQAARNLLDNMGHPYDTTVNYFAQARPRVSSPKIPLFKLPLRSLLCQCVITIDRAELAAL
jgi:subtilisin family serine protease